MVRVPRYRVRGRRLCCFGFVPALSGLPNVVLDDYVAPVKKLETKNSMALLRAFEDEYGEGSVKDVVSVPKCGGYLHMLIVHLEYVTDEAF